MSTSSTNGVPEDFLRGDTAATVPGAQLKFIVRKIDGRFVVGLILRGNVMSAPQAAQFGQERHR